MAFQNDNTMISNSEMLARLLVRVGHMLASPFVAMANASGSMAAVKALNAMSDEQLAAQGTTRSRVAQQMFRHDG